MINRVFKIAIFSIICFWVNAQDSPKNVILMIGDGMGLSQVSAAYYQATDELHMTRMPVIGLMTTHSANDRVTDSAAAGTALATGQKTNNGHLGVNPEGERIKNIAEYLKESGYNIGLVASCFLTHATPGAFFGHQISRNMYEEIAEDFITSNIDIAIAGGSDHFNKRKSDKKNLIKDLEGNGYTIFLPKSKAMDELEFSAYEKVVYFTDPLHPPKKLKGRDWLPNATGIALDFLKAKGGSGFFIMIEGSQIDWAGHDNDIRYQVTETIDFDEAVGKALDFVESDGETLLIVLADHETGGMGINGVDKDNYIDAGWTTKGHTATMIPVFAYGPGSEAFGRLFDNIEVFQMIKALLLGE